MRNSNISIVLVLTTFSMVCATSKSSFARRARKTKFKPVDLNDDCYGIECRSPSRYPKTYINTLANKMKLDSAFGQVFEPSSFFDLKLRSPFDDDDDEGENVCSSKEVTTFPKTAKDENYKLRFIVNTKEHRQGITYQICVSKESFINKMLLNYYFFCKQNYSTVRLLYLTENGKLEYGKFPVPSACVCSYKIIKK